jgi:signal transduction histidine kinase/CheY-like chemotaxis protein
VVDGLPVATRNILADPDLWIPTVRGEQIAAEGYKAAAAAPLSANGRVHGALVVHYWTERDVSADELGALSRLAEQAALAIETARLCTDARRRAARLKELVSLTRSVNASLDPGDVMQRIAEAAAALSADAIAIVHVHDPDHDRLRHCAAAGGEVGMLPPEFPAGAGFPGLVFTQGRPVLVASPATHPGALVPDWWRARPAATYYGVPIVATDTVLGVLGCILPSREPSLEEQEMLQLVAAHAGIAMRNAARYDTERQLADRIRGLAAINRRLSGTLELEALLATIAESAARIAGVRFVSFWLVDEWRCVMTLGAGSDAAMVADLGPRVVAYDRGAPGWTARHRAPLVIDDVFADARVGDDAWWRRWGLRALATYPVHAGTDLLAVIVLAHAEPVRMASDTRGMMELFIAQAAVAIQNARLYREAGRRRDIAEALARLGQTLTATLDAERIADIVARGAIDLLRPRSAAVYRYDAQRGTLDVLAAFGADGAVMKGVVLGRGEGAAGRAVVERRPVTTTDLLTDPSIQLSPDLARHVSTTGIRAVAAVPLLAHERVVGALGVGAEVGRAFSADDLQALQSFGDQAALALENARLYASARENLGRLRDTQAQLVQAAKMSAVGELVSGVAHELNNPLSVIIGYGQLLLGREIPADLRRPIELMVSQGDRMGKIVRSLLFFARQRPPERGAVDVNRVLEETLALRRTQLVLSGIALTRDLDPDLPSITADGPQLQQVFLNLLLNAEQAIGEAGGRGTITLRTRVSADRTMVCADVVDDGPGIPPDIVERVFEPFFTTKRVGTGAGLGLSLSYGIVEQHAGRLTVDSRPGMTVFTVELPVSGAPLTRAAVVIDAPLQVDGRPALVVEDEPSVLELVVDLLEQTGWCVDVADGGRAALARVRTRAYDLVVSDIRMPDGSGQDFYRAAVADEPAIARRFLFITGDTANATVWEFLRQTGVPVIEKPFTASTFLHAVRRVATALTPSRSSA